jgi:hypothetical protein
METISSNAKEPEPSLVMIRGIPKEGWKLFLTSEEQLYFLLCDDQRNP